MQDVRLRPMTNDELTSWMAVEQPAYIARRVQSGEPREVAVRIAEQQHAEYFPGGRPAPGHEFFALERRGRTAGRVWIGPRPKRADGAAWLYNIEIEPDQRGQGLGRIALTLLEEHLAQQGYTSVGLNVFGYNEIARNLYQSAGYTDEMITMSKDLQP